MFATWENHVQMKVEVVNGQLVKLLTCGYKLNQSTDTALFSLSSCKMLETDSMLKKSTNNRANTNSLEKNNYHIA